MTEACIHHSGLVAQFDGICKKLDLIEKSIQKQLEMYEKSVTVAKNEMDRRLEGMNEFRAQLSSQTMTFISRKEVELLFEKAGLRIDTLSEKISLGKEFIAERKGSGRWSDHIITVLVSLAVFILARFLFKF